MENLSQYALNKRYAEDTANRVVPSAEQFRNGIEFKSEARSNTLNGNFYLLSQAIQYLQFTGGLYDNNAIYNEGNIVSCVIKDVNKYRLWKFRRNSNNAGTLTGNAPITGGSIESVNGVDVYVLGSVSSDWDKLEDFNYSSEATPNFIISRDNEGSAKIEMPGVVDDKSIINKSYLKAINVSYEDNKSLGATNLQNIIDKILEKLSKNITLQHYYIQFPFGNGTWSFSTQDEPSNWYRDMYGLNTTWQLLQHNDSVFFRMEGDLASAGRDRYNFQDFGMPNIGGWFFNIGGDFYKDAGGCFWAGPVTNNYNSVGYTSDRPASNNMKFDSNRVVAQKNDITPRNRIIRIFRLTAIEGVPVPFEP